MRRRLLLASAVLAPLLLGGALLAWLLTPEGPGLTRGNFCRVRPGMTYPEVVAILGEPDQPPSSPAWMSDGVWRGEGCLATVEFGGVLTPGDGLVMDAFYRADSGLRLSIQFEPESLTAMLRRWLRL